MTRLALFLAVLALAAAAHAQGALVEGIVTTPSGLCLDFEGTWSNASPPPPGTAVVLSVCDGSDDQRWAYAVGDFHGDFTGVRRVVIMRQGNHAAVQDVDHTYAASFLGTGPISLAGGCLTTNDPPAAGERPRIEPCDGRPTQSFVMR